MYSYAVTLFILLCISLAFSSLRTGKWAIFANVFQWIVTLISIAFFIWWLFERSFSNVYGYLDSDTSVTIINRLPENIDFYVITCDTNSDMNNCVEHLGKISQHHYKKLFLNSDEISEYYILGFVDNKKLVYSSLDQVNTQILEITDYVNHDKGTSDRFLKEINNHINTIVEKSILISLDILLIFLHLAFIMRNKIKSK